MSFRLVKSCYFFPLASHYSYKKHTLNDSSFFDSQGQESTDLWELPSTNHQAVCLQKVLNGPSVPGTVHVFLPVIIINSTYIHSQTSSFAW